MRRQREDESGLGNLHDGLADEARNPRLVHAHPCCRLQPERLSSDHPAQGDTMCSTGRRIRPARARPPVL